MSWLSDAIGDVGSAVESTIGSAGEWFGSQVSQLPETVSNYISDVEPYIIPSLMTVAAVTTGNPELALGSIGSIYKGTTAGSPSVMSSISSGLSGLTSGSFTGMMSGVDDIFTGINTAVSDISSTLKSVVDPIETTIKTITGTVQSINDSIVSPIKDLINAYNTATTTDLNKLTDDINGGLTGILALPGDLTNALTGVDAQFSRATQQLGDANESIVKESLVPGLTSGIGGHIDTITTVLASPEYTAQEGVSWIQPEAIQTPDASNSVLAGLKAAQDEIASSKGFFANLIRAAYDILRFVDYEAELILIGLEPYTQAARSEVLATLLSPGEALEATRRGIFDYPSYTKELSLQGIGPDRAQVLYELANYLFGPRETVELYQRGIISSDDYNNLLSQNNLDTNQGDALTQLMQRALGPADIASAIARGYIDSNQADAMYQAALVPESLRAIIPELEKALISPEKMVRYAGRATVAEKGFLSDTLNSKIPDDILNQYNRNQAEQGLAQLDWLGHWDVPGPSWWCSAYFRGLVTLTQVEQAFEALNLPQETWYNIIEVERELPPVWLVPDIVKTGVWSADKAIPTLMQLGFSQENAQVLYDYGKAASSTAAATTADALSKLSLGNAKSAFSDGIIDSATYTQVLIDHKYSPEAAKLTVEIEEYNLMIAAQKANAEDVITQVKLGEIDQTQAQSQLYNLGLTTTQVDSYMLKLSQALRAQSKLPSESMLKDMYKKGLITQTQAIDTLNLLGYSDTWAPLIAATW